MDSATIDKLATTAVIAGAAFAASKIFEFGWKAVTKRPIPSEDSDDVTLASLVSASGERTDLGPFLPLV